MHWPTRIRQSPGTIIINPNMVKLPGSFWTPERSIRRVAMKGYRVMARAGMIGSGNMRLMATIEMICPKDKMIAIYMKPAKCLLEKMLQIPQKESKLQSQPLMK